MTETETYVHLFVTDELGNEELVKSKWYPVALLDAVRLIEANGVPKYEWSIYDSDEDEQEWHYDISFDNWLYLTTSIYKYKFMLDLLNKLSELKTPTMKDQNNE